MKVSDVQALVPESAVYKLKPNEKYIICLPENSSSVCMDSLAQALIGMGLVKVVLVRMNVEIYQESGKDKRRMETEN